VVPLAHSVGSSALQRDGLLPTPSARAPCDNSPPAPVGQLVVPHDVPGSSKFPGLVHFPNFTSTASCKFLASDVSPTYDSLKFCLIGFVAGKCPGYNLLSQFIVQNWNYHANLIMHDSGWLIFEFLSESAMLDTLGGGPYAVFGRPLILQVMPDFFDFSPPDLTKMPIWVRFLNLPIRCWTPLCLSKLASVIGKPLHCDEPTYTKSKLSYARVLIEDDLLGTLPDLVSVQLPNGSSLGQQVLYESLPRFCKNCASTRHSTSSCKDSSSKRKLSSSEGHSAASPSTVKPTGEPQHLSGSCPLDVPLAAPLTKMTDSPTSWRLPSQGRKRTKVFLANTIASTSAVGPPPCQGPSGIPPSWQFLNCSSAPPVTHQYMGQLNSCNLPSSNSSDESARTAPL